MAIAEAYDPAEVRFWRRVERAGPDECWNWTGHTSGGYGRIRVDGRRVQAHRYSYELVFGPIASDLLVDHLCRNQRCVNPAHLEPVTPRENTLRGESPAARQARQTTCYRGHPLSGDNLKLHSGKRECRRCVLLAQRARRRDNRDKINAQKRAAYHRRKVLVAAGGG